MSQRSRVRGHMIMSAIPARQNVGQSTVCGFTDRMVRWVRLRLNMMTAVTAILEPLSDCFPIGMLAGWAFYYFFCINPVYFFIIHIISWMVLDYILLSSAQNGPLAFSEIQYVIAWIVREFLSTYIYILAVANPRQIKWGPRTFKVKYGGLVENVDSKSYIQS